MRYLSVCSGIEAATAAWHPLGWQCAGVSEIEPFPRAVLHQRVGAVAVDYDAHRWADGQNFTPMFGDFTQIEDHHVGPVDILVGGTPCQSFSVAGKRLGLDDPRGNLTLEFLALAKRVRPRWLVWENVPGILSHDGGRTFGTFLGLLAECGFERWAYRVLDAQYVRVGRFGRAVPQRRRRVFVVGYSGTDRIHPRAVLFDRESLRWNPAPRREAGQGLAADVVPSLVSSGRGVERCGETRGQDPVVAEVAPTLNAHFGEKQGLENQHIDQGGGLFVVTAGCNVDHSLRAEGFDASEDGAGRGTPLVPIYAIQERAVCENPNAGPQGSGFRGDGSAYTLEARNKVQAVAYQTSGNCGAWETGNITGALDTNTDPNSHVVCFSAKDYGADAIEECSPTPRAGGHTGSHANAGVMPAIVHDWRVRRLTPTECERLQAFPDGWTKIEWRGKPADQCPDGPRYKALGNSMAVNVMSWIGERIAAVDAAAQLSLL
jgi:DNA (cytosine-5)-methyltransferase 1